MRWLPNYFRLVVHRPPDSAPVDAGAPVQLRDPSGKSDRRWVHARVVRRATVVTPTGATLELAPGQTVHLTPEAAGALADRGLIEPRANP